VLKQFEGGVIEDWCEAVQGKSAGSYGRLNSQQRGRAGRILLVFFLLC